MSNIIKQLYEKNLTNLDGNHWMKDNIHYITVMGSTAYGVSTNKSDMDLYSFCMPPKEDLFPHLRGDIVGFGNAKHNNDRFKIFQEHHIQDEDKEYDVNVYNIVDFFQLVMENNPNMIDSLYTPQFCVLHATRVAQMIREKRKMFLHRGAWHTFKGYAYSQLKEAKPSTYAYCVTCECNLPPVANKKKCHCPHCSKEFEIQNNADKPYLKGDKCSKCGNVAELKLKTEGKRKELIQQFGYDVKFAYHIVRLLNEVEQILTEGDLDLQRCREQLKSIRRGEWTLKQIEEYFAKKELELETLYNENKAGLPWGPKDDGLQDRIKELLFNCLEEHYGSLDKCVVNPDAATMALREMGDVLAKYRKLL